MQFKLFAWIREGVRRSVILGVNDAVEEIGAPQGDEAWKERLGKLLEPRTDDVPTLAGGQKRRLGRSLKDIPGS